MPFSATPVLDNAWVRLEPLTHAHGPDLARAMHGTRINPAMKLLLLKRAFEQLECIAVELRTDRRNAQSRAAIEKLGARQDGVLRQHMIMPDGHLRDTVVYSILAQEWPAARDALRARLAAPAT